MSQILRQASNTKWPFLTETWSYAKPRTNPQRFSTFPCNCSEGTAVTLHSGLRLHWSLSIFVPYPAAPTHSAGDLQDLVPLQATPSVLCSSTCVAL